MSKLKRMRKKFNYGKDRKREWKKRKTLPKVNCGVLEEYWDKSLTHTENLTKFGLSHDPNATFRLPTTKELLMKTHKDNESTEEKAVEKPEVIKVLEEMAKPFKRTPKQTLDETKFCKYMIEKYKADYAAMARDRRNYYQLTASQIKKKVDIYHQILNFEE